MSTPNPIFLPPSQWPDLGAYDVIVIGAGPGGIIAAVAAARRGARTLLIEQAGCAGGVMTLANCPHPMGFGMEGRQIVGGLGDEFIRRLDAAGHARLPDAAFCAEAEPIGDRPLPHSIIANIHGCQLIGNRMLREAGVACLYHTRLIGAVTERGRVTAVAVDRPDGPGLLRGTVFVDASGDAVLVGRAGGRVCVAEPDDCMAKTLLIELGGVTGFDKNRARQEFEALAKAGKVPLTIADRFMGFGCIEPGVVHVNYTAVAGDGLSAEDLTRMEAELREQIEEMIPWYRRNMTGFENCYLVKSAMSIGIRAGRTAVGLETIAQIDIDENTPVAESVGLGLRRYGDHGTTRFEATWRSHVSGYRAIPWRTLLSADFANVAMAGRCISCEARMLTCIRYIAQCMATGHAAGLNAALALDNGGDLAAVGYNAVRDQLRDEGAILE